MRVLDRTDLRILKALQKDARLSNKELAERAGIAPSTCLERIRRLKSRGVLRGFHAVVDPKALGVGIQALMAVRLSRHSQREVEAFRKHALAQREVLSVTHVAGVNDFLLRVAVRDSDHLRELAMNAFTTRKEVAHIETSLIFDTEAKAGLPIYVTGEL